MMTKKIDSKEFQTRRLFLKGFVCTSLLALTGETAFAKAANNFLLQPRSLAFHNLHTEEKIALTYFDQGQYVTGAMDEFNYLLRDHRSGEVSNMDPQLFDQLYDLQNHLGGNKTFQVISGYRSPKTNAMLKKNTQGVAKKSLHMLGKAVDVRIERVESKLIQQASIAMKRGGVGYYRESDFVHLDTGKVRSW